MLDNKTPIPNTICTKCGTIFNTIYELHWCPSTDTTSATRPSVEPTTEEKLKMLKMATDTLIPLSVEYKMLYCISVKEFNDEIRKLTELYEVEITKSDIKILSKIVKRNSEPIISETIVTDVIVVALVKLISK